MLPEYDLSQWARHNPLEPNAGNGYGSAMLARTLINGLVLVNALLRDMRRTSPKAYAAVSRYLDKGRVDLKQRPALTKGKRLAYDWLVRAAKRDEGQASEPLRQHT